MQSRRRRKRLLVFKVLLSAAVYKAAMLSAEAKNSSINYRKLQSDLSWVLLNNNPDTDGGFFIEKLNVCKCIGTGYYESWPQIGNNTNMAGYLKDLNEKGWPAIEGFRWLSIPVIATSAASVVSVITAARSKESEIINVRPTLSHSLTEQ